MPKRIEFKNNDKPTEASIAITAIKKIIKTKVLCSSQRVLKANISIIEASSDTSTHKIT
jgi:hypothetical protein